MATTIKFYLLFCIFNIYYLHSVYPQRGEVQDSLLFWNANEPLKWKDFHVISLDTINLSLYHYYPGALSKIGSDFYNKSENDVPDIVYLNYFNRESSWVTKNDSTLILLKHEQLHFDIAELYARKIRKNLEALAKVKERDLDKYYTVIESLRKELKMIQEKYDLETGNGSFLEYQLKWNSKIILELSKLSQYALNYSSDKLNISTER